MVHLQALAGYKFQIDSLNSLRISGGYARANNEYKNKNFYSRGKYQLSFGKAQYTNIGRYNKKNLWGSTLLVGVLSPDFKVQENYFSRPNRTPMPVDTLSQKAPAEDPLIIVTQKGLVIEPSIFYHRNFSKRFGMTLSFTIVKIIPLNQRDGVNASQYKLDYFPAIFGANFSYTFRKRE